MKLSWTQKFLSKGLVIVLLSACAINTEKVIVTTKEVSTSSPQQATSSEVVSAEGTSTNRLSQNAPDNSFVIDVSALSIQQKLELYEGLQSMKPAKVSDVVKDQDNFRVRFADPVSQDWLSRQIRDLASLGSTSFRISFENKKVFIAKAN
jgi:hypothetical protein